MTYRLPTLAAVAVLSLRERPPPVPRRRPKRRASAGGVVHTVIFYLKEDAPSGTADAILADCHEMLAKIPTVRHLKAGRPLEKAAGPRRRRTSPWGW